ncbi:hypothetical protein Apa02nite_087590 [Actinoplanes palleronii]|uniref:Uncharacterized protein n=1 Tax=Actinoplanes palleronii TaxID=113570 RepID=A0ABQ4BPQ9_9ACTN|nr:hypothetical protein Apa02nite_087590 [Actinoplanes palleronii]
MEVCWPPWHGLPRLSAVAGAGEGVASVVSVPFDVAENVPAGGGKWPAVAGSRGSDAAAGVDEDEVPRS